MLRNETYWGQAVQRRITRRRLVAGAGTAAAAFGLAACGQRRQGSGSSGSAASSASAGTPRSGGKVNVRILNDPFDWDVSLAGKSIPNDYGQSLAYDNLLTFKHGADVPFDSGVLQPSLAASWETPDPVTYVFHLRPGVKFADLPPLNGRALTASDIKWSYEYWSRSGAFKDKKLPPAQYASYFEGISSVDAVDPQTVTVRFSKPFVPFLNYTGSYFNPIVPHDIYDADGNLSNRIVGTGPWQIDLPGSQKGSRWVWKRNPNYWDAPRPYVDEVHWIVLPDAAAGQGAFQTKQIDILGVAGDTLSAISADQIKKANPAAMVAEYLPVGTSLYLNINCSRAPLKDARVRQAMSLGLDRDDFIKTISAGRGGWALSGAFPETFSQDEIKQILHSDPAQAKQLLAAAGYTNGVDVEFIFPGTAYGQDYVSTIQLLQAQLKKVGINLNLKSMDKDSWTNRRKTYDFQMTGSAKADLVGDVDSWLYDFHSGNKSNYSQTSDPNLDKLIDAQRQEVDATKRKDLIRQAVKLIAEQAYSLSAWSGHEFRFWQPTLKNYAPNNDSIMVPQADNWVTG